MNVVLYILHGYEYSKKGVFRKRRRIEDIIYRECCIKLSLRIQDNGKNVYKEYNGYVIAYFIKFGKYIKLDKPYFLNYYKYILIRILLGLIKTLIKIRL